MAPANALPFAAAGLVLAWVVRRRRGQGRKRRDELDGDTSSQASMATSAFGDSAVERRALGTVFEGQVYGRKSRPMSWDQLLALAALTLALALGLLRQSWDLVFLMGLLLLLLALPHMLAWRQQKAAGEVEQEEAGRAGAGPVIPADPRLVGVWIKDGKASDPMDTACEIMALNGLVRMAVSLVKGIELSLKEAPAPSTSPAAASGGSSAGSGAAGAPTAQPVVVFELAVFSVIAWFKVRERYELGGPRSEWNRRDLRRGKHVGSAHVMPDGGVRLDVKWNAPLAGGGYDEFRLESDNELHVTSHIVVGARKHTYTQVYQRKK